MLELEYLLNDFMSSQLDIDIYNEVSLQFELGLYLRDHLYSKGYKVLFEKNIYDILNLEKKDNKFIKKEIDLVIEKGMERYAIELKYPKNGMYPEEMYEFLRDICFMEQVKKSGFISTYALTYVNDKLFYSGTATRVPYSIFRNQSILIESGTYNKPTGDHQTTQSLEISGEYSTSWRIPTASWIDNKAISRYYFIAIK